MLVDWLTSRMARVWFVFFSVMELLSLLPSQSSSCVLISEEANTKDYSGDYACASMHEAIFRLIRFIWDHADHDNVVAFGTIAISVFTYTLWRSTSRLWGANVDQLRLAREEFSASHRPQLRLKHLWFATQDGQQFFGHLQADTPMMVRLDIVNTGNNAARLQAINIVAAVLPFGQRLPQRPPYNEPGVPRIFLNAFVLNSGVTFTQAVTVGQVTAEQITLIRNGTARLWFIGTVEYWWGEDSQHVRQTAFCRYLRFDETPPRDDDTGRFEIEKDPDYEYQD